MEKVTIHVGESMRDVLARNPQHSFDPDKYFDDTPIVWPDNDTVTQTFNMTYDGADGAIHFPHARLIWARQYAGVVTDVLVGVSEKKMPLQAFLSELQQTAGSFQRAGWAQSGSMPTLDSLRSGVSGVRTDTVEGGLLGFRKGSVSATLQIQGFNGEAGKDSQDSSSYTLNVQFTDQVLHEAQQDKTYREHLRVKGQVSATMPLSYWLNRH